MTRKQLCEYYRRFRERTPDWTEEQLFRLAVRILLCPKMHSNWYEFARQYLRWDLGIRRSAPWEAVPVGEEEGTPP